MFTIAVSLFSSIRQARASMDASPFNEPERGAWCAAFSRETSEKAVAYHTMKQLREINWQEKETFSYADFRGAFHDTRSDPHFVNCLDPSSYSASQHLARELLEVGSADVVHSSVRHKVGT